jgi:hypothetical protein
MDFDFTGETPVPQSRHADFTGETPVPQSRHADSTGWTPVPQLIGCCTQTRGVPKSDATGPEEGGAVALRVVWMLVKLSGSSGPPGFGSYQQSQQVSSQ